MKAFDRIVWCIGIGAIIVALSLTFRMFSTGATISLLYWYSALGALLVFAVQGALVYGVYWVVTYRVCPVVTATFTMWRRK